jgi:HD-GYP domain-containing protein (c-di-GMP phosphodiesterase class II)
MNPMTIAPPKLTPTEPSAAEQSQWRWLLELQEVLVQVSTTSCPAERLAAAVASLDSASEDLLVHEERIALRLTPPGLRINDRRVLAAGRVHTRLLSLEALLRRHRIGHLVVERGATAEDWMGLCHVLMRSSRGGSRRGRRDDGRSDFLQVAGIDAAAMRSTRSLEARDTIRALVSSMQSLLHNPDQQGHVALRPIRRAVQDLVDQLQRNAATFSVRRALDLPDGGLAVHSTRVCILSVGMGQQLGLDRAALRELGLCGVLHDIGKQRLAPEIVEKRGPLTTEEWTEMQRHPREGLMALQDVLRGGTDRWRPMLAAYEHHMKIDQSGYPQVRRARKVSLYSRIVSVADVFDAVTSRRSYRSRPWQPELVLRNMLDQPRWGLDRSLVKVLLQANGLYPVGSLVLLEDGRTAAVIAHRADAPHQPLVRLATGVDGTLWPRTEDIDLAEPGAPGVVRSLDTRQVPVDLPSLLEAPTAAIAFAGID